MQLPIRSAIRAAFAGRYAAETDPLKASRGDLHEATARRLGIQLADRADRPPLRVKANRADRRRDRDRADVLASYSRTVHRSKESNQ